MLPFFFGNESALFGDRNKIIKFKIELAGNMK